MATNKNKKGSAKAKLSWSLFHGRKRGVEAWWGFLVGAIICIAVAAVIIVLYANIKGVSLGSVSQIGEKLTNIFK